MTDSNGIDNDNKAPRHKIEEISMNEDKRNNLMEQKQNRKQKQSFVVLTNANRGTKQFDHLSPVRQSNGTKPSGKPWLENGNMQTKEKQNLAELVDRDQTNCMDHDTIDIIKKKNGKDSEISSLSSKKGGLFVDTHVPSPPDGPRPTTARLLSPPVPRLSKRPASSISKRALANNVKLVEVYGNTGQKKFIKRNPVPSNAKESKGRKSPTEHKKEKTEVTRLQKFMDKQLAKQMVKYRTQIQSASKAQKDSITVSCSDLKQILNLLEDKLRLVHAKELQERELVLHLAEHLELASKKVKKQSERRAQLPTQHNPPIEQKSLTQAMFFAQQAETVSMMAKKDYKMHIDSLSRYCLHHISITKGLLNAYQLASQEGEAVAAKKNYRIMESSGETATRSEGCKRIKI